MGHNRQCEVAMIFNFTLAEAKTIINHIFKLPYVFKSF